MGFSFRTSVRRLSPPWLARKWGERLTYVHGLVLDGIMSWAIDGVAARFPSSAPDDGLPLIARDRPIVVRGFSEPVASLRARLRRGIDDSRTWGNAVTTLEQLAGYLTGYAVRLRTVDAGGTWVTLEAGAWSKIAKQDNWDWDGSELEWARDWVIVDSLSSGLFADDGEWQDEVDEPELWAGEESTTTWGSTLTLDQADTLRFIAAFTKPAGTRCVSVILQFDSDIWEPAEAGVGYPDGTWSQFGHDDGTGHWTFARNPGADYMMGSAQGVA